MDRFMAIFSKFCEFPERRFQIRELAKLVKINHTTVRQYLNRMEADGLLVSVDNGVYKAFRANPTKQFLNLKLYYNLEKLRKAGLIELLEKEYDYPTIVLFGSYSQALDTEASDVDLCLLTEIKQDISLSQAEKKLNRKFSLFFYNKSEWKAAKAKNPELVNSICNGMVLSGKLEVV